MESERTMPNQELIEKFEGLLSWCERDGMDKLISYIRKSDFYTAPASTKYHSCHEGGLLEHSLNVAECLLRKADNLTWKEIMESVGRDSILITSLLHDISKTNFYTVELKNKKVYSDSGKKFDAQGKYDWQSVPYYKVNDTHPLGHGEGSVIMLQQFISLKPVELYAIRFHMGFTEPKEMYNTLSAAIRKYPFILALHTADLEATYMMEKEE